MNINSIGIDFGTTKTLVSCFNERVAKAQTIRLGRGRDAMPTSIYVGDGGQFFFGEDAEDELQVDPSRYCRAFKMKLGQAMPAIFFVSDGQVVQFSAVDLCTLFFKHIKERVEQEVFMGQRVQRAVVTCPVIFSPKQREELKLAAESAGFAEVEILTEPEAAGYAFCQMCPAEAFKGTALVVDWGGGTLDMAAITRQGHDIVALRGHSAGALDIGGEHFDDLLCLHAMAEILRTDQLDYRGEDGHKQYLLRKIMQETKELLSKRESKLIRLSSTQGACSPIQLEKKQFEQMIEKSVNKAALMLKDVVHTLREEGKKIELLLLVGGSAQIPFISQVLEQSTQIPCKKWQYSHEAVSLGAGLIASGDFKGDAINAQTPEGSPTHTKAVERKLDERPTIIKDSIDTSKTINNQDLAAYQYQTAEQHEQNGNMSEAVKYYRQAAELGHVEAQFNLGYCYECGNGVSQNLSEAVKWYQKAAEQGFAYAQFNLGRCYEYGNGVSQNASEAVKWYQKAAEQGDADAQCNLGVCYEQGKGVSQNASEAVKWYQKAAEQGIADAQCNLGNCYVFGNGVSQNLSEAVKWYQKAAEQGFAYAQGNLGVCYEYGNGVSQNLSEAVKWYQKAAEQGDTDAGKKLEEYSASYYDEGINLYFGLNSQNIDTNKAFELFKVSYQLGNNNAAYMLCMCYQRGQGTAIGCKAMISIAHETFHAGFAPTGIFLALAYESALLYPLDKQKCIQYAQQVYDACYHENPLIDNNVRLDALLAACNLLDPDGGERYHDVYSLYIQECQWTIRYSHWCFYAVKNDVDINDKSFNETLDYGCGRAEFGCLFIKGLLLSDPEYQQHNINEAIKYLRLSAKRGFPLAALRLSDLLIGMEQQDAWSDYWKLKNYGAQMHANRDQFAGELSLSRPVVVMPVYQKSICEAIFANNPDDLYQINPPTIFISNRGKRTLCNCILEITFLDTGAHSKIKLTTNIKPNEHCELKLEDYEIEWGMEMSMTLWVGETILSCITIEREEMEEMITSQQMPLRMFWERGSFAGIILYLLSIGEQLNDVVVSKESGVKAAGVTLLDNDNGFATVGWMEFSDSASLQANEVFVVSCPGYQNIGALIIEGEKSDGGASYAAAAIGGGILAALLGG